MEMLLRNAASSSPLVLSVPHAGERIPAFLLPCLRTDAKERLPGRDTGLEGLTLPECAQVINPFCRAAVDVNRSLRSGCAEGQGLFPLRADDGHPLWRGRLSARGKEERLREIYRPYHEALSRLLRARREKCGIAMLIDLHSFPGEAAPCDAVLGSRNGRTCPEEMLRRAASLLEKEGLKVQTETPFPGGEILRRHAGSGCAALQLELSRDALSSPEKCRAVSRALFAMEEAARGEGDLL